MTRDEWLAARRTGIGGSDIAAILGLSPWRTPLDVYRDKVDGAEQPETEAMRWGRLLEDVIAREYAVRAGVRIQRAIASGQLRLSIVWCCLLARAPVSRRESCVARMAFSNAKP
jgi:putative phage-type endonuclease